MEGNNSNLNFFFSGMYVSIVTGSIYANYILFRYRSFFCTSIIQNRELHRHRNLFIDRYCSVIVNKAAENSIRLGKILTGLCIFAMVSVLFLGTATTYFFQESEYPLPVPVFLYNIRPTEPIAYIINWITQTLTIVVAVDAYCGIVCCLLINAIYIIARFDAVIALTKAVQTITVEASFKEYCRLVADLMEVARE